MMWRRKNFPQTTLLVKGIRCNHCESNIKLALSKISGVRRVKISKREQVMIEFDTDEMVSHHRLVSAIQNVGYQLKSISDAE
jgi:copper chaperone CopZ